MSKEPYYGLVISGYGIYTPSDQKYLKAYIAKIETEARIATLKEVDDRLCELHQKTEGAANIHFVEVSEYLADRILKLQNNKKGE